MELRVIVAAVAAAGLPVVGMAQERVTYSLDWSEVLAGSNQPVVVPHGMIEPGEGVRIAIRATITPGIGATATYTPPPPPGVGTIAGLGAMIMDLYGTNVNGGTWSNLTRDASSNPGGIPGGGNRALGAAGYGQPNGDIIFVQAGQYPLPGTTANSSNPIVNAWRGTWTPSTDTSRTASFRGEPPISWGDHSFILIQHALDANGDPMYIAKSIEGSFGNMGPIPIVPSPGVLVAAIAAGGLIFTRGRRTTR